MEPSLKGSRPIPPEQKRDVNKTESSENFQTFIYELFDKNGVLNDLRAYLRGHIVDVLKSAQTGDSPSCQKQFTQRLDSTFQALNMLVAEYLLCMEFNYSLSVFVSEIPLANMVFGFAKSLMGLGADGEATGLRFRENDVWSILSYLGVKCDSEHANRIVVMYKSQVKSPLLLCILQCSQLCDPELIVSSREGSISSKSSNADKRTEGVHTQCRHHAFCKACRSRYRRVKDKYRKKKAQYIQKAQANAKALNVETLMKNIGELERSLVDEMFEQLKTVYETEIDMYKAEHEDKIKVSLASHVQHFQQMQHELEESFKAREAALKASIVHKKRFLWGLAQALRAQHSQMSQAMQAVRAQTAEVADQEQKIKLQRTEAEQSLRKRAEEMRQQIADELVILERHLESMKTERESINRERVNALNSEIKMKTDVKTYLQNHYQLWKEELDVLKMYIENSGLQPKRVMERGTMTDDGCRGMNNEVDRGIVREVKPNQVVNDLKKQKNVNFSQSKLEGGSRGSGHSSSSSEEEPVRHNERQQPPAASAQARLQAGLRAHAPDRSLHETTECGWRKGAGEERSLLPNACILVPGDTIPFVGVVRRRSDSRRHLLNRWRAIRRRASPLAAHAVPSDIPAESAGVRIHSPSSEPTRAKEEIRQEEALPTKDNSQNKPSVGVGSQKTREKSPRSVLKEAKEKLKTVPRASASREKSPSAVLREAKLRLRKLEIEAEAVERSYMDFRRRRENTHPDRPPNMSQTASKLSIHRREKTTQPSKTRITPTDSTHLDLEAYLKKYQIDIELEDHFKNKTPTLHNAAADDYHQINGNIDTVPKDDYLNKPILEFRKLYYTNPDLVHTSQISLENPEPPPNVSSETLLKKKCSEMRHEKNNKLKELEILQQNISKIYDLQDEPTKDTAEPKEDVADTDNLLIVEVENVSEVKDMNAESENNMIVVVEGSVDSKEIIASEREESSDRISTKMTIVVSPTQINGSKGSNVASERAASSLEVRPQETNFSRIVAKEFYEIIASEREESSDRISTKMTIVVSPTQINGNNVASERAASSLEVRPQETNFNRIVAKEFYEASGDKESPHDIIEVEMSNDPDSEIQIQAHHISETDDIQEDYADDFSYDVDNYKSDEHTPISLPKSEDENFWDSN